MGICKFITFSISFYRILPSTVHILLVSPFAVMELFPRNFFSGLCLGNAMVAYTEPQHRKKEESEQLRGEGDKIKFIDLRFE